MNLPFGHPKREPGEPGSAYDARPLVAIHRKDRTGRWFAGGAVIAAVLLFTALEARRQGSEAASAPMAGTTALAAPEAIPDLVVPMPLAEPVAGDPTAAWPQPGDQHSRSAAITTPQSRIATGTSRYVPDSYAGEAPYALPPPPINSEPYPPAMPAAGLEASSPRQTVATGGSKNRIMAGRLENPSSTVIQGTLINAVLETALDSTRPGQTRAIVTRDVFGFDGTQKLIPRGTRLYGVYEADVAQGQNRAQIRWTRLLRPDGVSVALDSPAADPLGRAGIRGKVDNHFFQRLGNALVGASASVGSALATQSIGNSPVVVAVPGTAQTATQAVVPPQNQIMPTLTVQQGTRITVFVQHDLDFSSVDGAP